MMANPKVKQLKKIVDMRERRYERNQWFTINRGNRNVLHTESARNNGIGSKV